MLNVQMEADLKKSAEAVSGELVALREVADASLACGAYRDAIAGYERALELEPDSRAIWRRRAAAIRALDIKHYLPQRAAHPANTSDWTLRAGALFVLRRFAEAEYASECALVLDSSDTAAQRLSIQARLHSCNWSRRRTDLEMISHEIAEGRRIISPFNHRALSDSEAESLALARIWARRLPEPRSSERNLRRPGKIRVAYLSTDLRDHVVSDMIAGCLERHDKTQFEITAISLARSDGSNMRRRLEATFDRFIEAELMSDGHVVSLIRELDIDIAVDMNGNSGDTRTEILALRPAPLQVSFLGYPGTMGTSCYDYIIADRIVLPETLRRHYTEGVAYLPDSYMPNDAERPIAPGTPSRADAGLPKKGFVFACHNSEYKIGPEIFAIWMNLLSAVDSSVLWLKSVNGSAIKNLRQEAARRGVDPARIIFARRIPETDKHLARLRAADLFVDTLPYNAHATACDALWAGLPVLTCMGDSFPGRVAGSILNAAGLPDLTTAALTEYEEEARRLANDPRRLAEIRDRLARNRATCPLFDTKRYTRNLESAYRSLWARQQSGLAPEDLIVEA